MMADAPSSCDKWVSTSFCPTGFQTWRDDFQCGTSYVGPNGCDAYSAFPCCSELGLNAQHNRGWCGATTTSGVQDHCHPGIDYRKVSPFSNGLQPLFWTPPPLVNLSCTEVVTAQHAGFCLCDGVPRDARPCGHANLTCAEMCGTPPRTVVHHHNGELTVGESVEVALGIALGVCSCILVSCLVAALIVILLVRHYGWTEAAVGGKPGRGAKRGELLEPPDEEDAELEGMAEAAPRRTSPTPPRHALPPFLRWGSTPRRTNHPAAARRDDAREEAEAEEDEEEEESLDPTHSLLLAQAATIERLELQCMRLSSNTNV